MSDLEEDNLDHVNNIIIFSNADDENGKAKV